MSNLMQFNPTYNPEDYHQIQINGQRITSLKSFHGRTTNRCVRRGNFAAFSEVRTIHQFRLMIDHSGMNRGFGYLVYCNDAAAQNALATMKGFAIRPNWKIYVSVSNNYRTLIYNFVQFNMSPDEILNNILFTKPIQVTIGTINYCNRIVLITYSTSRDAELARRVLLLEKRIRFGHNVLLGWFKAKSISNFSAHNIFLYYN